MNLITLWLHQKFLLISIKAVPWNLLSLKNMNYIHEDWFLKEIGLWDEEGVRKGYLVWQKIMPIGRGKCVLSPFSCHGN
jgi:hypothetical protein